MSHLLLAVDIGNSGLHLGSFSETLLPTDREDLIVELDSVLQLDELSRRAPELADAMARQSARWFVASVHRGFEGQLAAWVARHRASDRYSLLGPDDFGLRLAVLYPERVGRDRLAAAAAANVRRRPDGGAIVVDAGSAITVDYVDPVGTFVGGAILPGPRLAARAMADYTDALPLVELPRDPPFPLGRETRTAMESGLYWGTLGAVRELVAQIRASIEAPTELFLTGGAARHDHFLTALPGKFIPHLTLEGIALAARRRLFGQ